MPRKRKPPSPIDILGHSFRVIEKEMPENSGEININDGIITILPDQSDDNKADTLLHEIIHGVELLSDMKLRETEVLRIATGLRSVLKGRNVLCKYLFSLK